LPTERDHLQQQNTDLKLAFSSFLISEKLLLRSCLPSIFMDFPQAVRRALVSIARTG
jgi:hypothetical protein